MSVFSLRSPAGDCHLYWDTVNGMPPYELIKDVVTLEGVMQSNVNSSYCWYWGGSHGRYNIPTSYNLAVSAYVTLLEVLNGGKEGS